MSRRYRVSREEIAAARDIPLLPLLERRGYTLVKDGRYYRLADHDSVVIDPQRNRWYWNSQGILNANTVDWLMLHEHLTLPDAVAELCGYSGAGRVAPRSSAPPPQSLFSIPARHTDGRRVFGYLVKARGLDPALVAEVMKEGLVYEDTPHHNAVFLRMNDEGAPAGYFARGTITGSTYKNDPSGSDKRWTFLLPGKDPRYLYVTEAAIDALSIETLRRRQQLPPRQYPILSLAGNSIGAVEWYLHRHPVERICCCTDNDEGGEVAYAQLLKTFPGRVFRAAPPLNDWNDVCQSDCERSLPFMKIEKESFI